MKAELWLPQCHCWRPPRHRFHRLSLVPEMHVFHHVSQYNFHPSNYWQVTNTLVASKFSPRRCNLTGQNHHRSSVEYCMQRVVIKCERSYIKVRVAREAELHKSLRLRPLMNIHIPVTKCLGYPILLYRTERAIERPYRNPQPRENAWTALRTKFAQPDENVPAKRAGDSLTKQATMRYIRHK